MKRRTFIFQTGTLITTAMLAQCNTAVGTKTPYTIRRPNPNDFKAPALKAIALGVNAPNPHNTRRPGNSGFIPIQRLPCMLMNRDCFLPLIQQHGKFTLGVVVF
jgi:hypothetical protein